MAKFFEPLFSCLKEDGVFIILAMMIYNVFLPLQPFVVLEFIAVWLATDAIERHFQFTKKLRKYIQKRREQSGKGIK